MRPTLAELENPKTLIHATVTAKDVTDDVIAPIFRKPDPLWTIGLLTSAGVFGLLVFSVIVQLTEGIGILGINNPAFWGTYITNFVFWIGIGHAGTLISAILFLFRQKWRTSINRSAEAMTIFAVVCAGLFPLLHTGRPWLDFWLFPYPNTRGTLWPQFRSPLVWDVFAISTYATTSLLFWYLGLIPDFATIRDRAKSAWQKALYSVLSFGWRGNARHWNHYERAYAQFAWIATPLVLSVHSTVSFDFAVSKVPGWHTTIFPPYFVAGAIFGGFGMVVFLLVPMRKLLHLEKYITINHLEICNKFILATGMIVSYAYAMEFFAAWFSESKFERHQFLYRLGGAHAWVFWTMTLSNCVAPLFFWSKRVRRSLLGMWIVTIFVNIGMWFERFNIFVLSIEQDHVPAAWDHFVGTKFDWLVVLGSFGLFFTLFLVFCKAAPTVAIAEIKSILVNPSGKPGGGKHHHVADEEVA